MFKHSQRFLLAFALSTVSVGGGSHAAESYMYSRVANDFVNVGSIRYAFRKVGATTRVPLVLLIHTRGNMDSWDPALVDALASQRLVIAFDNKGVGLSNGKAPESFEEMADDAAAFIKALGYQKVDILGFSIGGAIGQELLIRHPGLIRRAILGGTSAKGGEGVNSMSERSKSASTKESLTDEDFLYDFFAPSATSQARGKQFLSRLKIRQSDNDVPVSLKTARAQAVAREKWGAPEIGYEEQLKRVLAPVFIGNGKDDIRMPAVNSYNMFKLLPKGVLTLYPDSGHGFLFEYPRVCAEHFNTFLNQDEI